MNLKQEEGPRHLLKAVELLGVKEVVGPKHNPVILGWAKELGIAYNSDEVPWCFSGDTLISTMSGYKKIKDIQVGVDLVLTKEDEFCNVNKLISRSSTVFELKVTGAMSIRATGDHMFLVKKMIGPYGKPSNRKYEEELCWIKISDLKKGDLICRKKSKVSVKSPLDNQNSDFIFLLGTYAAEGTYRKGVVGDKDTGAVSRKECSHLHIGKHEKDLITSKLNSSGIKKYYITERRTCLQIEIHDDAFNSVCKEIGHKGELKSIPYFILNGTDRVKYAFLEGYLNGDGWFDSSISRGSVSSISKMLIAGAGKILIDSGIIPSYRVDKRAGVSYIEGRRVNIKDRYIIQYTKTQNGKKSITEDDDYYYLPIRSISEIGEEEVYDMEVDKNHNFVANDMVVHNCGLFAAVIMHRAGRKPVDQPLWALNWNKFGVQVKEPMLGDVLTFTRKSGGHVGLYVGETDKEYMVLGGNQGNAVSVVKIAKSRLSQARRPEYKSMPANIRKVFVKAGGPVSENEA